MKSALHSYKINSLKVTRWSSVLLEDIIRLLLVLYKLLVMIQIEPYNGFR